MWTELRRFIHETDDALVAMPKQQNTPLSHMVDLLLQSHCIRQWSGPSCFLQFIGKLRSQSLSEVVRKFGDGCIVFCPDRALCRFTRRARVPTFCAGAHLLLRELPVLFPDLALAFAQLAFDYSAFVHFVPKAWDELSQALSLMQGLSQHLGVGSTTQETDMFLSECASIRQPLNTWIVRAFCSCFPHLVVCAVPHEGRVGVGHAGGPVHRLLLPVHLRQRHVVRHVRL